MTGRNWTELFFLDEAVAIAAGHRPCAYCRRAAYTLFCDAWGDGLKAPEMDAILHRCRAQPGARSLRTHRALAETLPAGSFVQTDEPLLLTDNAALPYAPTGYGSPRHRPTGQITVLTSEPMIEVLRCGYIPTLHPSAQFPLFP